MHAYVYYIYIFNICLLYIYYIYIYIFLCFWSSLCSTNKTNVSKCTTATPPHIIMRHQRLSSVPDTDHNLPLIITINTFLKGQGPNNAFYLLWPDRTGMCQLVVKNAKLTMGGLLLLFWITHLARAPKDSQSIHRESVN